MPDWEPITDIEPSTGRYRILPDGRKMFESKITVSRAQMEMLWQGYMCAACLENVSHLGPFPAVCPLCGFGIRLEQRNRLQEDFAGEIAEMHREGWIEREEAFLEEKFHLPKTQIHVRRKP